MKKYLSLVKFAHTIFALPFAMLGFFIAVYSVGSGGMSWELLLKVVLCMVFARSAAMAFNRYVDREIDAENPRTKNREIPSGVVTAGRALLFVIINSILFVAVTFTINPLCFYLSPVALLVILGYSYLKRFTALCHLVLGAGLALAPVGAYLAVRAEFGLLPVLYGLVVLCWVSGFDIIYALQDDEFDRDYHLHSIPQLMGREKALSFSFLMHLACAILILIAAYLSSQVYAELGWIHWMGALLFIGLLFYQHTLVKPGDLGKVDIAFFSTNGVASVLFCTIYIVDLLTG